MRTTAAVPGGADLDELRPSKPVTKKLAIALVLVAAVIIAFVTLPIGDLMRSATAWVESLGFWAPVAYIAIYIVSVILFVPGSVMTAAAGTLFGVAWGSVWVSVGATIGATFAFLIGRYFARDWVAKRLESNEKFAALDAAVADEGWKIVGLTRLSPAFPFTLLNYAYGVTKVKLSHYVIASWIGMIPGSILYVYVGAIGKAATEAGGKSAFEWAMYGVGLLATIAVTIYITKIAKRALGRKITAA